MYLHALASLGGLRIGGSPDLPPRRPGKETVRQQATSPTRNLVLPSIKRPAASTQGGPSSAEDGDDDQMGAVGEMSDGKGLAALKAFNGRHSVRAARARRMLSSLNTARNKSWEPWGAACDTAIAEIFRNRLWLNEEYNPLQLPAPRRRGRRKWRLDDSIWLPRRRAVGEYYESDRTVDAIVQADFECMRHGIERILEERRGGGGVTNGAGGGATNGVDGGATVGDDDDEKAVDFDAAERARVAALDALDAVCVQLQRHGRLLYAAFNLYAVLGSGMGAGTSVHDTAISGELDIFTLTQKAFTQFTRDCGLLGVRCPLKRIDGVWEARALRPEPEPKLAPECDRSANECSLIAN